VGTTTDKPPLPLETDEDKLERMSRETDAILATTARLIAELDVLLEESRQLGAARKALVQQRREIIKKPK
jgi:hypothetical protein